MFKVSGKVLTFLAVSIIASSAAMISSQASAPAEEKIRESYNEFANILNSHSDAEAVMKFLHESISQDAEFVMNISNPDDTSGSDQEEVLTKADYINSYIYGPRMVNNYNMDINVETVEAMPDKNAWVSRVNFMESGSMKDMQNLKSEGRPFTSYTSCDSVHGYDDNHQLVIKQSICRTEILFEQDV